MEFLEPDFYEDGMHGTLDLSGNVLDSYKFESRWVANKSRKISRFL